MEEIMKVIIDYFEAWTEASKRKDATKIRELMSRDFQGYWSHAGLTKPDNYGYNYDIEGVLVHEGPFEKKFEVQSLVERHQGNQYIAMGRETNIINGQAHYAQCMFIWRKEQGEWKLLREYIELEK